MKATMQAWAQEGYGPASAVRRAERAVPVPGKGEVLLKVHATALNAADVRIMLGEPLLVRPAFGFFRPRNPVRGMDVAGTVVAVGPGAGVVVGDEVVAELGTGGGLAEYAVVRAARVVPRPPTVSPRDAACLPMAGGTARQALDLAAVRAGARVLVLGASGGVGTFAVQLAVSAGAEVHATCSARNAAVIGGLGAREVFDRERPLRDLPAGYDAVIDIPGVAPLRQLRRLIVDGGRVVLVGGTGGRMLGPIPRILGAIVTSIGSRRRIRPLAALAKPDVLRALLAQAAAGEIAPVIDAEYGFADAGAALSRIEAGHAVGKIVVTA